MMQKHRISTNIGRDQKINIELNQDFSLMEILSLKLTQKDVYTSLCSDYGVVCGRISVNDGFGIPNARVSIFIPLSPEDEDDPVISALYPYKTITDKDEDGYRYNLLPARQQHGGHAPTGTFPDQLDIISREEILEVYEKYYKYTVKTNDAGDFMIWGVPLGEQTLHIDVDLSDIGCFSLRPYDFLRKGYGVDDFKNTFTYKSSNDINSLPQIKTFDKTIEVYPFWGNEDLCEIGITRTDFDLSEVGVKIEPKAFLIGGTFTDSGKNSINKNCMPRAKMGRKCSLHGKTGKIEAIRFTPRKDENNRPILEEYGIDEDIPEDGSFVTPVAMNMDFVYTNEFGENEITNDTNKGIPTSACYRFRFTLNDTGNERVRKTASYLVPNIREYQTSDDEKIKSYAFSTDWYDTSGSTIYPTNAITSDPDRGILYNVNGEYYPRDYFYRMTYNKVYTVSSFQNIYYPGTTFRKDKFIGIKEIVPGEEEDCQSDIVTPPANFGVKQYTFSLLIADILLFFEQLINTVTLVFFNTIAKAFHGLADAVNFRPIKRLSALIRRYAYRFQNSTQRELYLINYPECDECNPDNNQNGAEVSDPELGFCAVGTIQITGATSDGPINLPIGSPTFYTSATGSCGGATFITDMADLMTRQTEYILTFTSIGFELSGGTITSDGGGGYLINDPIGYFPDDQIYIATIRDKSIIDGSISTGTTVTGGCDLYDVPYDESLVEWYYTTTGDTRSPVSGYTPGMTVVATNLSDSGYSLPTGYTGDVYQPKTPSGDTEFTNGAFTIIPGSLTTGRVLNILREYRRRKRVGVLFCGGIVNYAFIDNWLSGSLYFFQFKGKKGKYCTDVVKYISEEEKYYYRSAIYTNETTWGEPKTGGIILGRPTTIVDLGPRDEFINQICVDKTLDPNCSVTRSIGPSSAQSFGEILGMAINYRMDVSDNEHDINDFFDNTGFTFTNRVLDGDILQLISINNEAGIEEFDLQNPRYAGYSYEILDPEIYSNVFKPNGSYWGPLPITFYLDEDGERVRSCLNEPTHLDYSNNLVQGRLTESSQKVPFFLWDKKGIGFGGTTEATSDDQSWDYGSVKVQTLQGMTTGYTLTGVTDDSTDKYLLLPITYTFSGLTITGLTNIEIVDFDVIELTDNHTQHNSEYPGFTYLYVTAGTLDVPTSGTLYTRYGTGGTWDAKSWKNTDVFIIRRTQDYYSGTKQILSTPFMFYFGVKTGKTGVDKFIELFGPKGAFPYTE